LSLGSRRVDHAVMGPRATVVSIAVFIALLASGSAHARSYGLGVTTPGVSSSSSHPGRALDAYARRVHRMPAVVMWYQSWYQPWRYKLVVPRVMKAVKSRGAVPMITWLPRVTAGGAPASLADIAAGRYDRFLRRSAAEADRWGKRFFLRPFHEMNGRWQPWGVNVNGNDAATFIAAWRHVVRIFNRAGATNVRFVFSPNVISAASPSFTNLYPGDRWVDWTGLDGYNFGAADWRSFRTIYAVSYWTMTNLTRRPLLVCETASAEGGGNKGRWVRRAFLRHIPNRFPRVHAVIWFNRHKERDWRVNSSSRSLRAYRAVAQSRVAHATGSMVLGWRR
jgi:hypothetical protein